MTWTTMTLDATYEYRIRFARMRKQRVSIDL